MCLVGCGLWTAQMNPTSSAWAALEVGTSLALRSGSSNLGTLNFNKTAAENAHKAFQFAEQTTGFSSLRWKTRNGIQEKLRKKKRRKREGKQDMNTVIRSSKQSCIVVPCCFFMRNIGELNENIWWRCDIFHCKASQSFHGRPTGESLELTLANKLVGWQLKGANVTSLCNLPR